MENRGLVILAKRGDKDAFSVLYKTYFARIYRYCVVNMYKDELAQDVCQETFVRAWRALPHFSLTAHGTFQAFLFKIAHNLIVDLARKKKEFSLDAIAYLPVSESFEQQIDKKDSVSLLKKTLARLNSTDRQIIMLRYFEELRYEDIEKVTGIKAGALRVRTMRIVQKLKEAMKDYGA